MHIYVLVLLLLHATNGGLMTSSYFMGIVDVAAVFWFMLSVFCCCLMLYKQYADNLYVFSFFQYLFFFFWEMCLQHWNINFSALWPTITNEYNFFWEYCCCSFFYVKIFCFMSNFSFDSRLNFLVIFVLAFVFIFVYNLSCIPWSFVVHLIFFLYSMDGWILDGWLTGWMFDCSAGVWWWGFAID